MNDLLDIVDDQDRPIAKKERQWFYATDNHHFRVVNLFIQNDDKKILITKRSNKCEVFPNLYDFSAGGHVRSSETYEMAMSRELYEELGIISNDFIEIGYFPYPNPLGTFCFSKLYYLTDNYESCEISNSIQNMNFYPVEEIFALLHQAPHRFKSDFSPLFNYFIEWSNSR